MSTEHFFGPGTRQHLWLEADLAAVNRSRTPWLVLVGHRWGARPVHTAVLRPAGAGLDSDGAALPSCSAACARNASCMQHAARLRAHLCRHATPRRPVYIDADEYGDQGKQTTALQVRCFLQQWRLGMLVPAAHGQLGPFTCPAACAGPAAVPGLPSCAAPRSCKWRWSTCWASMAWTWRCRGTTTGGLPDVWQGPTGRAWHGRGREAN